MHHEPRSPPEDARRLGAALHAAWEAVGVRRLAAPLRHLPDRVMHPARRRRVRVHLRRMSVPGSVLFVCHGNLYRSPYAAHLFAALLPDPLRQRVEVASAGFVSPGRPSPTAAVALAAERRLDMSPHRSSLLAPESVRTAGLIVVMDVMQQRAICGRFGRSPKYVVVLGDLDPRPIETRAIQDPWGKPQEVLAGSYARIERCVGAMVAALLAGR